MKQLKVIQKENEKLSLLLHGWSNKSNLKMAA